MAHLNFNIEGAITSILGLTLQCFLFMQIRPRRVLRTLEESLAVLDTVLVDMQTDGIPDDGFPTGWDGARAGLDQHKACIRILRSEVNGLTSLTSELKAIFCGLSCRLYSLRRKVRFLLAEVSAAERRERQRQREYIANDGTGTERVDGASVVSGIYTLHVHSFKVASHTPRTLNQPLYDRPNRNIAQPIVGYDVSTDDEGRAAHHSPSQDIESTAAIYSRTAIEAHAVDQHLDMMRKMRGASNHANAGDATPPISAAPAANHNIAVQSWRHELNKRLYANGIKTRVRWQLESLHRTQGPWVAIAISE